MTTMPRRSLAAAVAIAPALLTAGAVAVPPDDAPGLAWKEPVTVATGNGHRGPWRMNRSDFDFVDDPTVSWLPDGDLAVAWVDQSRQDILLQRFTATGEPRRPGPVNVSASPDIFSWLPRLAVAPDDARTLYVLWQEIVFSGGTHGGEIFFARSTDGGRSFTEPVNLSRSEAGDGKGRLTPDYWHNGSLDIAVGPDGVVYAAWTEYEGRLHLARSTDSGETFTEPRRVAGGSDEPPARAPSLAAGGDGTVHLAWTVGGDAAADIRYARSTDGARTFTPVRAVHVAPGHADAPKLAVDGDGTVHLAYGYSPEGPLERYDVLYTRRDADADAFESPRKISTPLPGDFVGAGFPYLALAGEGRVYIACELFPERGHHRPRGLALMRSRDGGDTFIAPRIVPGTADRDAGVNGSQQGLLMRKLDANDRGALAVVNSKFRRGESSRIRLLRADLSPAM